MDSLTDIAVFVQVVESGSFTAAAERLSLSKSVISKYVTRLEDRLGARLLNRTTRRLSLTEAGRAFYERSERGLQELAEAELEVSHLLGEPRGTLRINAPMSFGVLHIAPAMPSFLQRYQELSVDINFDDRKVDVIEAGFDVSIRISELGDSSLVARRLGPCRHAVVASPAYLEQQGVPRTPEDLERHNVISYRYQESAREWEFGLPGEKPVSVSIQGSIQMNNSLALREAVLNGAGIMRAPTFVVGEDIRLGRLQPILANYILPEVSIYAVFAQRKHLSPKVRAFVEFMGECISDTPHWDQKTRVNR
ncbi:MAG: LysR family transcriptional regulator [Sedimenticola sp.]|nr:LysR family transcriptional regulator [Sedimenticola sp.]